MARLMVISERNSQTHPDAGQPEATNSNDQAALESDRENTSQQIPPTAKAARFCSQCDLPVKPEQKFCQNCGNALPGRKYFFNKPGKGRNFLTMFLPFFIYGLILLFFVYLDYSTLKGNVSLTLS